MTSQSKRRAGAKHTGHASDTPPAVRLIWRRLASVGLWYGTLAASFIIILIAVAFYQPKVVSYLVLGAPALTWLTSPEASHMADVHGLIRDALLLGLSAWIIAGGYWLRFKIDRGMARSALAMQLVLFVLLIPFNWTFEKFHEAFFPQGNWMFPSSSWLIRTFPTSFFATVAIAWFLLASAALWAVYRRTAPMSRG